MHPSVLYIKMCVSILRHHALLFSFKSVTVATLDAIKRAHPSSDWFRQKKLCASSPIIRFDVHERKSVHTCIMSQLKEKSLGAMAETEQEVGHFELIV